MYGSSLMHVSQPEIDIAFKNFVTTKCENARIAFKDSIYIPLKDFSPISTFETKIYLQKKNPCPINCHYQHSQSSYCPYSMSKMT